MHMSRVKNNNLYKECFHLPLEYEEKETLQNLLEIEGGSVSTIESDGKEMIAEKSKEEGNFYCNLKQHKKALEAYTFGLQSTDSEDLKHQIRLNICRVFFIHQDNMKSVSKKWKQFLDSILRIQGRFHGLHWLINKDISQRQSKPTRNYGRLAL